MLVARWLLWLYTWLAPHCQMSVCLHSESMVSRCVSSYDGLSVPLGYNGRDYALEDRIFTLPFVNAISCERVRRVASAVRSPSEREVPQLRRAKGLVPWCTAP